MDDGFANNDNFFEHVQNSGPPPTSSLVESVMAKLNNSKQNDTPSLDTSRLFYGEMNKSLEDIRLPNDWYWDSGC